VRYALLVYDSDGAGVTYVLASASSATCVRGDLVTDGPYDGTASALHAIGMIEVDTLDDAIEAAARVEGTVEIRPLR
jgi:hypothetical protein